MTPEMLNIIGLGLDIVGVGILALVGFPISMKHELLMENSLDLKRAKVCGWIGVICLLFGFGFQIYSNWI